MGLKSCDKHPSGVFVYSGDACPYCSLQRVSTRTQARRFYHIDAIESELKGKQAQLEKALAFIEVHGLIEKGDSLRNTLQYAKLLEARVAQLERANHSEMT